MLDIAWQDSTDWSTVVTVDKVRVALRVQWMARTSSWYLSVGDADADYYAAGVRMVQGFPLLARVSDARRPPGDFMVLSLTGTPGRQAFAPQDGTQPTAYLVYMDEDDLAFLPSATGADEDALTVVAI